VEVKTLPAEEGEIIPVVKYAFMMPFTCIVHARERNAAEHVPDAGSYAPVTILVDERPDGESHAPTSTGKNMDYPAEVS